MKFRFGQRCGISRPEILFILSVLLGIASVLIPAFMEVGQRKRSSDAFSDIRILVSAANRYNREYRLWPVVEPPARGDARFGWRNSNAPVLRILRGVEGEGNEMHRANLSQIDFIKEASEGLPDLTYNEKGEAIDPWGNPYEMVFDSNYDSICSADNTIDGPVFGEGVIVWSSGPDQKPDTRDDLRSWAL